MYALAKILFTTVVLLSLVIAFVSMIILGIAIIRTQNSYFKLSREINRRNKPVEKPQIIKKSPAPKEPVHYTWKNYLRLIIFLFAMGSIIYQLFF